MEKNASTRSNNAVHLGDDRLQTFINPLNRQEQADSGSVEIISVGPFSPYKSQLFREFSEEIRRIERQRKRSRDLLYWNWDDVVSISSSNEEIEFIDMTVDADVDEVIGQSGFDQFSDSEDEVDDTADSLESYNRKLKVPKVSIHRRSCVVKL
ncbi:hypothetical protein HanRHA438_Chr06g0263701 [Helianthus annuus]|uniref:Uncharacterized protein n=1 Tax=Helianthus annuus TaxID=4232 RepID=A0A9K3NJI2_HELAN|nr:hypothetical protein HanXRQr2_Chr06g0254381 [Helianthus annuus]KAJ0560206.1 hypothetical protein HanHA300_Chr06g0208911 [Helianthus annuus]KAJ0566459.1 hypothetical protein HanIR_Chr06g0273991 [Helianthus annuus]KAJ0573208.1 hypothetical protein HanHA89_Chr06g0224251 [Helianthus annuus]KAJ0737626.1 hypothetical protein HanLR1_Chr06g0209101 [Helianthus annuus]